MLLAVVSALVLATLSPALADMHPAAKDGQRLEDQSADVQATYHAIYGDDAAGQWIHDHNAELDSMMMMMDPRLTTCTTTESSPWPRLGSLPAWP